MMETTDAKGRAGAPEFDEAEIMHDRSTRSQWLAVDKYVSAIKISYVIVGKTFCAHSALSFGPIPREIF